MKTYNDLLGIDLGLQSKVGKVLKCDWLKLEHIPGSKKLEITVRVYTEGSELVNKIIPFECKVDKMVNSQGLMDDNGDKSEYDFFEWVGGVTAIEYYTMIYKKIIEANERGKFDI